MLRGLKYRLAGWFQEKEPVSIANTQIGTTIVMPIVRISCYIAKVKETCGELGIFWRGAHSPKVPVDATRVLDAVATLSL